MAQSGWYDDPDGTPDRLRYWDGTQWTGDTMPRPSAATPSAAAPSSPSAGGPSVTAGPAQAPVGGSGAAGASAGGYSIPSTAATAGSASGYGPTVPTAGAAQGAAQQGTFGHAAGGGSAGWQSPYQQAPMPPARPTGRSRRGCGPLLVLALLALIGWNILQGLIGSQDAPTPTTTTTSSTSTSTSTSRPTNPRTTLPTAFPTVTFPSVSAPPLPTGTGGVPTMIVPGSTDCPQPQPGRLSDGTITVSVPQQWTPGMGQQKWAEECSIQADTQVTSGWSMGAYVGQTSSGLGKSAAEVAESIWTMNANAGYGKTPGRTENLTSEAVTVGGLKGHKLTGQVRVTDTSVGNIPGDDVQLLVVQKADGTYHALLTVSMIDDKAGAATVQQIWQSLKIG